VLINLLDNALKFTPVNGRICVQLQSEPPLTPQHEPGIRCLISDNGPGIPVEHREQIFNRFMRTNRGGAQIRGTGLGLAFCKMAVEAHNGRIWVEAASEDGSQFIFTLPGIPILVEETF
jgi:signal transduction histidine kinase